MSSTANFRLQICSSSSVSSDRLLRAAQGCRSVVLTRCSCLQVLIDQRARQPPPAPPPNPSTPSSATQTPSRRSYQDGGSGHSFRAFDFSSLIGRDSSKSPKYPEKMLKVMDVTLQRIAMGQEPKWVLSSSQVTDVDVLMLMAGTDSLTSGFVGQQQCSGTRPGRTKRFRSKCESQERSRI